MSVDYDSGYAYDDASLDYDGGGGGGGGGGAAAGPRHSYAVTVEMAANPDTAGVFIIGSSLIGGSDLVAAAERWAEVPDTDVYAVSIRRGRRDDTVEHDAGTAVVELENTSGDYDPDNANSRFNPLGQRLLRVGTPIRVAVAPRAGGAARYIFHGSVADFILDHGDVRPTATLVCEDRLADLGRATVAPLPEGSASGDTTADRASWLLDAAGVPAAYRDVAGARQVLGWSGGGTARSALERLARGEAGRCRVTRDGVLTMSVHADEYGKTPEVVFTDDAAAGGPGYLVFDDFDRSNRTLDAPVAGPAPTTWQFGGSPGNWTVNSNHVIANTQLSEHRVYWDAGATAYRLEVDVPVLPADGGIAVRSDGDGTEVLVYFQPDTLQVYTYDGANYTLRATAPGTATAVAGMTVTVDVSTSEVSASTSTGLSVTWADSTHAAQTQVGLRENNAQTAHYDNLRVGRPESAPYARYSGLEVLPGSASLVNAAIVTRDGLDDVLASDLESVAVYGRRSTTVDVALSSDLDAQALADFHAGRRSRPAQVVSRLDVVLPRADADALEAIAALDLGSLAQVERTTYDGRPLVLAATVESMAWDLRPGRQALTLSTAPSDTYGLYGSDSWFIVGESLIGGTAVIAPY